jgi:hypothetical protein
MLSHLQKVDVDVNGNDLHITHYFPFADSFIYTTRNSPE